MSDDNLYLLTGTAEIFIQNRIQRIIKNYEKFNYALNKYDMETTTLTEVIEDCCTGSLFEEMKIIILRNPKFLSTKDNLPQDYKAFIKYLKNPIDETILIIDATNTPINQSNEIYKTLANFARIIDFSESEEVEIKGWITRACSSRNISITEGAVELFLEYINSDQIRMVNELEKMMDYVNNGGTIDEEVVKLLVTKDLSKEVFNLIKAIVSKDLVDANRIYQTLAIQTKDVLGIIAMISNSLKELLTTLKLLKSGYAQTDVARYYNVTPGRAYYLIKDAKNFEIADLSAYIIKMSDLDYKIKSGKIDKNIGIELLLLEMSTKY